MPCLPLSRLRGFPEGRIDARAFLGVACELADIMTAGLRWNQACQQMPLAECAVLRQCGVFLLSARCNLQAARHALLMRGWSPNSKRFSAPTASSRASTELKVYECDGWTIEKSAPELLLRPRTTAEVSAILRLLHRRGISFVPRGAGTGLSGGCLPIHAPVMICTSRMNHILAIDLANRRIEVESGVVNLHVTNAVKDARTILCARSLVADRLHDRRQYRGEFRRAAYAEIWCHHQSRARASNWCCPTARSSQLGGPLEERCGYDLVGAVVGAEGTAGIVTRATLRLTRDAGGASHAAGDFRRRG